MRVTRSDRAQRTALASAILFCLAAPAAHGATITVNSNDDSVSSTFCNLRAAITSINNAVAVPTCSAVTSGAFGSNDTIVFGALANSVITLQQGRLDVTKLLTITGSGQTIDANGFMALYVTTGGLMASHLTIRNGFDQYVAGGITAIGGTLALDSVTLYGNQGGLGGAVFTDFGATATITDSNLNGNSSSSAGGAIFSRSPLTVTGSFFTDNSATNTGGAVVNSGGSLTVSDSVILGNTAASGGAISTDGSVQVNRSIVSGNSAGVGGAMYTGSSSAAITIVESTLSGNHATAGNGGVIGTTVGGTFALINTTASGNTATAKGGVIYSSKYAKVTLTNATISGNFANAGGAMYFKKLGTNLTFANSIVSANSAATGTDMAGEFAALTGNNNLLGSALDTPPFNSAGNNNRFSDSPGLGPLQDNGGFTKTMAVLPGSLAMNGGSNASAAGLTTDQRGEGFVRIAGGLVDIGAYEYGGDTLFADDFEPAFQ